MVCGGPVSLGSEHGEPASGFVCRTSSGLEGRASPKNCSGSVCVDTRGSGNAQGIWNHGWAQLRHHLHDGCQSDPETAKQDEVRQIRDVTNQKGTR